MVDTESGMMTDVRLQQSSKAFSPMVDTESGMMIDVRLLQL